MKGAFVMATRSRVKPAPRVRMAPETRRQMIIDAAISFFAKNGLSAQIRDLAKSIGVSQALVFKYFESKENLLECVYQRIFLDHWNDSWRTELVDRRLPLRERLVNFYLKYMDVINDYDWIRICLQASLSNQDLTRRYINEHLNGVLEAIALEIRVENGGRSQEPPTAWEVEQAWLIHSAIAYYSVRNNVHQTSVVPDCYEYVRRVIDTLLPGLLRTTVSTEALPVVEMAK
jgi:AcrR family transcriptional regulator